MTAVRKKYLSGPETYFSFNSVKSDVEMNSLQIKFYSLVYYMCVFTHYQIIMTFCVWLSFNGGCGMRVCVCVAAAGLH